jgi:Subtilase family
MSLRFFAIGVVGVLTAITAASAVSPGQLIRLHAHAAGTSKLHVAGSRTPQQRASATGSKYDVALAEIARHVSAVRPTLQDLHALNPAARFKQPKNFPVPLVSIDAVTRGDPQQLKAALVGMGLQRASVYSNDVGGWLPVDQLEAVTALTELHSIRAAMPKTRAAVATQGDFVQNSDLVRSANSLSGAGVTVGILSDSYNCYAQYAAPGSGVPASGYAGYAFNGFTATAQDDIASGALPSTVNLVATPGDTGSPGEADCLDYGQPTFTPFSDEGRAMMQIVHVVAPDAALAFHTAENSEADFANGIVALAASVASGGGGATVIADDVGYFDEPFFQDGIVAQAVDQVEAQGVAYFSSAGNNSDLAYDNNGLISGGVVTAPPNFTVAGSGPNAGELLLSFDNSGGATTTTLPVTIPSMNPGEFVAIVVEWDQPYVTGAPNSGGATSQIDLCVQGAAAYDLIDNAGNTVTTTCTGPSSLTKDPYQLILVDNPASATDPTSIETVNIVVGLVSGGTVPGRIKVVVEDDGLGSTIGPRYATNSGTIQGHPNATGALAVGAAFFLNTPGCGSASAELDFFSSVGGDPILFDVNGNPQTAVYRQKPDLVGPDGGNDTFLGFTLAGVPITDNSTIAGCKNNASYPNFFGTSAATPHVASIAALLLQADPSLTPATIYSILRNNTLPMGGTAGYNTASGFGFVQADLAAAATPAVVPATPTLSLGSSSITVGSSTTLTWSSANNQGCTAGGTSSSWSGAEASSGSQTVTPAAVGSVTYTLYCTNNAGVSPTASIMLTVNAAASGGSSHGGGALGVYSLLGLLGLCVARMRRGLRVARNSQAAVT